MVTKNVHNLRAKIMSSFIEGTEKNKILQKQGVTQPFPFFYLVLKFSGKDNVVFFTVSAAKHPLQTLTYIIEDACYIKNGDQIRDVHPHFYRLNNVSGQIDTIERLENSRQTETSDAEIGDLYTMLNASEIVDAHDFASAGTVRKFWYVCKTHYNMDVGPEPAFDS